MPAFYTHSCFGERVAEQLDGQLKEMIMKHYSIFEIGLQGPDIFFFYKPLKKTFVSQYGNDLHSAPAASFFEKNAGRIGSAEERPETYSYLLGFLCHFVLDSSCHAYVEKAVKQYEIPHLEIEEELDKRLMRQDGKNPFTYPLAERIPTEYAVAAFMEPVFDSITASQIQRALKDMKRIRKFLTTESLPKQRGINYLLDHVMPERHLRGMMNQLEDNLQCEETSRILLGRFQKAIPLAAELLQDYDKTVIHGKALHPYFHRNYE